MIMLPFTVITPRQKAKAKKQSQKPMKLCDRADTFDTTVKNDGERPTRKRTTVSNQKGSERRVLKRERPSAS